MPDVEEFELEYLAGMLEVSVADIQAAIKQVGSDRCDIEAHIRKSTEAKN